MLRHFNHRSLLVIAAALLTAACGDSPLPTISTPPDLAVVEGPVGDGDPVQGCVSDGTCVLEPIIVVGPGCEPYKYNGVSYCADECIMSGTGDAPVYAGDGDVVQSCPGGGGGSTGGTGGSLGGGTGGGGSTGTPPPVIVDDQGFIAWMACTLAVLGSTYTVGTVADAFENWWNADMALRAETRMYEAVLANPEGTSPEIIQLYQYRVEQARLRRDDAMGSVSSAVNASYWALAAAGATCTAAAFMPTP